MAARSEKLSHSYSGRSECTGDLTSPKLFHRTRTGRRSWDRFGEASQSRRDGERHAGRSASPTRSIAGPDRLSSVVNAAEAGEVDPVGASEAGRKIPDGVVAVARREHAAA